MNKLVLKIVFSVGVLTSLFVWGSNTYAQTVTLSKDRDVVYCGDVVKLTYTNLDKEAFENGDYTLRLTCTKGASCIQSIPLRVATDIRDINDTTFEGAFTYAPTIEGFACAAASNLSVLMDTYRVEVVRKNGSFYNVVSNPQNITFNPYGDPAVTNCQITLHNPYSVSGGKITVTGKTNYMYNLQNKTSGKGFLFQIHYSTWSRPGLYSSDVTLPPDFLVGDGSANIIEIVGSAVKNLASPLQCSDGIVVISTEFSTDKDSPANVCKPDSNGSGCSTIELKCNDPIRMNASGLALDVPYAIKLVRTRCDVYNQQCNTPVNTTLHTSQQTANLSVQKAFDVGTTCEGSGVELDAGIYRMSFMQGNTEIAYRTIRLREQAPESCYISDVITPVYVFSGGADSGFKLHGANGQQYRVDIVNNGTAVNSVAIGSSGEANVVIPNSFLKVGTNTAIAVLLSDSSKRCSTTIIGKNDYSCSTTALPEACNQCPSVNGIPQICTEYVFNGQTLKGCRPDTGEKCKEVDLPPVCDISTPELACSSCGLGYECRGSATEKPTCQLDDDNSCGELKKYPIIEGIEGSFGTFEEFLNSLRGILIPLGIILAVVFFLICGYKFMTSQGQPDKMRDAKDCLTSAIIGLLVVTMSVSIINTLINLAFKLL